ncbi:hypothetical protein [Levilactobacillus phage ENFP1]|nr:hypothetical protein [Levilactobacillus phage ENFP1]
MQYAIKMIDRKGNWEVFSKKYAEIVLYQDKKSFIEWHTVGKTPYFFYLGHIPKFASYQEVNCLCKKLKKKLGDYFKFRPISQIKCLYLNSRNYSKAELSNFKIRNLREIKKGDPHKETPFESLRRKHREKENR